MARFAGDDGFTHGRTAGVGVLLTNLGTPDAPTSAALRRYLREFLSDPRVVELPRPLWWLILNLFVLPLRPRRSAALYRKIWTEEGSPLLVIARRQAEGLGRLLAQHHGPPVEVELGMRYGQPSIADGLRRLAGRGCRRILVLPLYPQYSSATIGSTFDAVAAELSRWRWVPELRTVSGYHDDPGYVAVVAASIRERWAADGEPDRLLFSFHGIPRRTFLAGDPYFCHCQKTARLTAEALSLAPDRWQVSFQSRFGREEWLQPYTDETLARLGAAGVGTVDVVCPGFAADCLETLEEIAMLNRDVFLGAGGGRYRYLPALNDRPDHLGALAALAGRHLAGWVRERGAWDEANDAEEAAASRSRALRMGAER